MTLDELAAIQAAYQVKVAACGAIGHAFTVAGPFDADSGKGCAHCGVAELAWLRSEVRRLTARIVRQSTAARLAARVKR